MKSCANAEAKNRGSSAGPAEMEGLFSLQFESIWRQEKKTSEINWPLIAQNENLEV